MKPKFTALAALLLLGSGTAQAQLPDTASQTLDPLLITANKYLQKQSTTGKVVTVITRAQIEANAGRSLAQLLNEQAGLTLNGALNAPGTPIALYTRGGGSGRTLLLIDGMPVNDPSNITGEYDLNLLSLQHVEQIEVCRGAQSTLYGSDAVAGVVNLITQKKTTRKLGAQLQAGGGTQGTARLGAQVYGTLGKFEYQARINHLRTDGFSAAYDSTGTKPFDRDGLTGTQAQAALRYRLGKNLTLNSFLQTGRYQADADAATFTDEKDFTLDNRSFHGGGGFDFTTEKVQVHGRFMYSRLTRHYSNDSIDIPSFTRFSLNDYAAITRFAELYASIPLGAGFTLLQGADFRNASYNQQFASRSSFGPFNSNFRDTGMSQASAYASLNYAHPKERFYAELGGRLNVHSRFGSNATYTFNPTYKFAKGWRALGSLSTGFKSPSIFQLYDGFSGNPLLAPETSKNAEAGLQYQRGKTSVRMVYFHRVINNGIDYNYISNKYFNFVRQVVNGLELEMAIPLGNQFSLAANYTYLSPRERTQNRATNKDTIEYNYLLRRPGHSLNATVGWAYKQFSAGVTGRFVGRRYDVGGFRRPDVALGDYFLLNAQAAFTYSKKLKLFANGQNLLNRKFFDLRGYNGIPLTVEAGVVLGI